MSDGDHKAAEGAGITDHAGEPDKRNHLERLLGKPGTEAEEAAATHIFLTALRNQKLGGQER